MENKNTLQTTGVTADKTAREPLISFHRADIMNGETTVIYGLNMQIYPGDFVYIVGKVGTGKTSIIRTIIAENKLLKGEGKACGYRLNNIRTRDIPYLRRKMGVVFQDFQLLMDRTVEDNLIFVLKATGWKDKDAIYKRIDEVLNDVGMAHKAHKMPHQLSGGEQQRIAIARALLNKPEVIIADEPTGNLDSETADGIMKLIRSINQEGTAVIMVTHNRELFEKYPGRIMVCKNEKCLEAVKRSVAEKRAASKLGGAVAAKPAVAKVAKTPAAQATTATTATTATQAAPDEATTVVAEAATEAAKEAPEATKEVLEVAEVAPGAVTPEAAAEEAAAEEAAAEEADEAVKTASIQETAQNLSENKAGEADNA